MEEQQDSTAAEMDPKNTYWDEDWLREKFVDEGLTMEEIADTVDRSCSTIHKWISKHEIERRNLSGPDDNELKGWTRIRMDDGLTQDERSELRDRQKNLNSQLKPLREEKDAAITRFAEEHGYDMENVSERLEAESAFTETERGKEIESQLQEKRQEIQDALAQEYSSFLIDRFEAADSETKKDRICALVVRE